MAINLDIQCILTIVFSLIEQGLPINEIRRLLNALKTFLNAISISSLDILSEINILKTAATAYVQILTSAKALAMQQINSLGISKFLNCPTLSTIVAAGFTSIDTLSREINKITGQINLWNLKINEQQSLKNKIDAVVSDITKIIDSLDEFIATFATRLPQSIMTGKKVAGQPEMTTEEVSQLMSDWFGV